MAPVPGSGALGEGALGHPGDEIDDVETLAVLGSGALGEGALGRRDDGEGGVSSFGAIGVTVTAVAEDLAYVAGVALVGAPVEAVAAPLPQAFVAVGGVAVEAVTGVVTFDVEREAEDAAVTVIAGALLPTVTVAIAGVAVEAKVGDTAGWHIFGHVKAGPAKAGGFFKHQFGVGDPARAKRRREKAEADARARWEWRESERKRIALAAYERAQAILAAQQRAAYEAELARLNETFDQVMAAKAAQDEADLIEILLLAA